VQISRLSSGKSFTGKRKKFMFNAFVDTILVVTYNYPISQQPASQPASH